MSGSTTLKWDHGLEARLLSRVADAQAALDSEVLRGCSAYVPVLTGRLKNSAPSATVIGSGFIEWATPYARRRYFVGKTSGSNGEPLRGAFWFERWKTAHGQAAIEAIQRVFRR